MPDAEPPITCEECDETFASHMAFYRHKGLKNGCLDPRTDLEFRVDNDGRWTLKPHRVPQSPSPNGFLDDEQIVAYRFTPE